MYIRNILLLVIVSVLMSWCPSSLEDELLGVKSEIVGVNTGAKIKITISEGVAPYKVIIVHNGIEKSFSSKNDVFLTQVDQHGDYFIAVIDFESKLGNTQLKY